MKRRKFIRKGALWLTGAAAGLNIIVPAKVDAQSVRRSLLMNRVVAAGGGGTPTGNSWTVVNVTESQANTLADGGGAVGDLIVVGCSFEDAGVTLNSITGVTDGACTLSTQLNNGGNDAHVRMGYKVASITAAQNWACSFSAAPGFNQMFIWRLRATGTITAGSFVTGSGTGTSVASSSFTSAAVNGIAVCIQGVDNSCTTSAQAVGGNSATLRTAAGNSVRGFDYIHTAQLSSATFTSTLSTSVGWLIQGFDLDAQ